MEPDRGPTRPLLPGLLLAGLGAALFGLLHGLGFAGSLREAGLPADADARGRRRHLVRHRRQRRVAPVEAARALRLDDRGHGQPGAAGVEDVAGYRMEARRSVRAAPGRSAKKARVR